MTHRIIGLLVTLALTILAAAPLTEAQPLGNQVPRIGELDVVSRAVNPHDPHRHGGRWP
jgi:hypothetical protein